MFYDITTLKYNNDSKIIIPTKNKPRLLHMCYYLGTIN